ncbi:hypothetical protein KUTeg_015770 [Tegillarca granosa]|uniref:C2H2-type domain-containing protein n=1 Tax=Tegillarca granosa TaxID=220873 RepID=A0ABQ9ENE4_TEGGR|nr:hypothetical protein KUTeg_015770 [Tegillarca granosa]
MDMIKESPTMFLNGEHGTTSLLEEKEARPLENQQDLFVTHKTSSEIDEVELSASTSVVTREQDDLLTGRKDGNKNSDVKMTSDNDIKNPLLLHKNANVSKLSSTGKNVQKNSYNDHDDDNYMPSCSDWIEDTTRCADNKKDVVGKKKKDNDTADLNEIHQSGFIVNLNREHGHYQSFAFKNIHQASKEIANNVIYGDHESDCFNQNSSDHIGQESYDQFDQSESEPLGQTENDVCGQTESNQLWYDKNDQFDNAENDCFGNAKRNHICQIENTIDNLDQGIVDQIACDLCDQKFSAVENLNKHKLTHIVKETFKCKMCSREFKGEGHLKRHIMLVHDELKKCDICGETFETVEGLTIHKGTHDTKPYKCDYCGRFFADAGRLKEHETSHTGIKAHRCIICGKDFLRSIYLKEHMLIHTGEKPHSCGICGKAFRHSKSLYRHKMIHTGEKSFKCEICNTAFSDSGNLNRHLVTHNIEGRQRKEKCEYCGKRFIDKGHLKSHIVVHTGERPFKCKVCFKDFARIQGLHQHMFIHTGEKNHICDLCGKKFSHSSNLKKHQFAVHFKNRDKIEVNVSLKSSPGAEMESQFQMHIEGLDNESLILS